MDDTEYYHAWVRMTVVSENGHTISRLEIPDGYRVFKFVRANNGSAEVILVR